MMDGFGQLTLKKYNSSTYRHEANQPTGTTMLEMNEPSNLKMNNIYCNQLKIPKLNKENINYEINPKSSKNLYSTIEQNNIKKFNKLIGQKTFLGQNLTNSCYITKQSQFHPAALRNLQKYQQKEFDQKDIVISQPLTLQSNFPSLVHKCSADSKQYKRHSHLIESTSPYYEHSNYQQYNTNMPNTYNHTYGNQSYRLRETVNPAIEYGAFETSEIRPCQTSRTNRPYEKVRNFYNDGTTPPNQPKKKYLNTTFPYTSSVTSGSNRQPFMSESLGQSKIPDRFLCTSKNNEQLKLSILANKIDNQIRARPVSRASISRELRLDDFQIGQCKGEGRFGKVYMAIHKKTGFLCALKKVKKQSVKYMMEQFIQEIKIQLFLNHPKLVKLYGYFADEEHFYLLIEYMEDGSLYSLMKKNKKIDESQTIDKLRQICEGVKQMHNNSIVHRDLKPENIVMTHGVCKVCDFGWAAICQDRRQTYCGTLDYVCPEIIQGQSYDSGVDVWCIGVLAYQMMCGKAPFYDISRKKTMQKIKSCKIENFPSYLSGQAIRFIEMILTKDPDDRTGIQELLDSDFLKIKNQ